MTPAARLSATIELMEYWQQHPALPFADILQQYLRQRRYIGSGDRRAITEAAWASVRARGMVQACLQSPAFPPARLLAFAGALRAGQPDDTAALTALCDGKAYAPAPLADTEKTALTALQDSSAPPERAFPTWVVPALHEGYGTETAALLASLLREAATDLRVNTLKSSPQSALQQLTRHGISAQPCPYAPHGIRLDQRSPLQQLPLYQQGHVELQDESAQLAALLTGAQPGEQVLDYCAGAGGKTLALAAIMRNRGQLTVHDSAPERLAPMAARLRRAGVSIVQPAPPLLPENTYHRVLVDAPCSGSGVWRRAPDALWRYTADDITRFAQQQAALLHKASLLVRPGGRLVYATCSLFAQENQAMADAFSAESSARFTPLPADDAVAEAGLPPTLRSALAGHGLQLTPSHHGCDGFFIALWHKKDR